MSDVLTCFHRLVESSTLTVMQQLQLVSAASAQVQLPPLTSHIEREVEAYTQLSNQLLPNLASESVFIQSLTLSFVPRIAKVLTSAQIQDVVSNIVAALDVYTTADAALPSLCALMCLYTIETEVLLKYEHVHVSTIAIVHAVCTALKSKCDFYDEVQTVFDGFCLTTILQFAKSQQTAELALAQDVELVKKLVVDLITILKISEKRSAIDYKIALEIMNCTAVITLLTRVPNYLAAVCNMLGGELLNNDDAAIKNLCRGFLAQLLTLDWFVGDDVEEILKCLRMNTDNGLNQVQFKNMVTKCYDNYCESQSVPLAARGKIVIK